MVQCWVVLTVGPLGLSKVGRTVEKLVDLSVENWAEKTAADWDIHLVEMKVET